MNSSMISGGGLMKSETRLTASPFSRFSFTASSAIFTTIAMPLITGAPSHTLNTIRDMFAAVRACWVPPPKDEAHHGMEYMIRIAFKRDGTVIAASRMTYSSHDVPSTSDACRVAIDAALKRVHSLALLRRHGWSCGWTLSPFALWMTVPSTSNRFRDDGLTRERPKVVSVTRVFISRHSALKSLGYDDIGQDPTGYEHG